MSAASQPILKKMLDRLFAALMSGPSMNCRPHSSRQRIDLTQFSKLKDRSPEDILRALLGEERSCKVTGTVKPVKVSERTKNADETKPETDEEKKAREEYTNQTAVVKKVHFIAEESRTYENDTGVHILQIGFPLLSIPPGKSGLSRRILAPLAFISVSTSVRMGPKPVIELECRNEGDDLVVPNNSLLAWLERQTGKAAPEAVQDEEGAKPWHEIVALVKGVCAQLQIDVPAMLENADELPILLELQPSPRSEDDEAGIAVLPSAVLGLYPAANQGLLRDTQAMLDGPLPDGPIHHFLQVNPNLEASATAAEDSGPVVKQMRQFAQECLITQADPCQTRAVKLSKSSKSLVVHGPPGTGKSQTITNIIGDHLARGERVLFVCDKRTALDVVMNRLDSLGLGSLCAIVHNPQKDQRDLYKSIREQLDGLTELRTDTRAEGQLARLDKELQQLHGELSEFHRALMERPEPTAKSFHELMGEWLRLPSVEFPFDESIVKDISFLEIEDHHEPIREMLDRAATIQYGTHPWAEAAGLPLEEFLAAPASEQRSKLTALQESLAAVEKEAGAIPVFPDGLDFAAVGAARVKLADDLQRVMTEVPVEVRSRWSAVDKAKLTQEKKRLAEAQAHVERIESKPLDAELAAIVRSEPPGLSSIAEQTVVLQNYLSVASKWYGFLAFGKKSAASKVLIRYGLTTSAANAQRAIDLLTGLKARLLVKAALEQLKHPLFAGLIPDDEEMTAAFRQHTSLFDFLHAVGTDPLVADLVEPIRKAVALPAVPADVLVGLRASQTQAERLLRGREALGQPLFSDAFRRRALTAARTNQAPGKLTGRLQETFDSLESVLRVRHGFEALPGKFQAAVKPLLANNVEGEIGLKQLAKSALANEISARIKASKPLLLNDAAKLQGSFDRYRALDQKKKELTLAAVMNRWGERQKSRLLVSTGSRLSGEGADVRRRLTLRGERALRLRQVIALGQEIAEGDPLFDLRPVWMCSPETVAQVYARRDLFDVVIFDEASQCRLEEALPVLLRAKRVVIAGDPKQLPPTRFFESAVAQSDEEEIETDQDLFEKQQGEMEDLLSAALNIEIDEAYLDVHYRSRNSDLIAFSNDNFYNSRLQAIPGHPANRTRYAPLTLYKANGVYENRSNSIEAERVCSIVRDLLKRAEPPSIGIACFNITQRDLIIDKLEELASKDAEFVGAYSTARERRGRGSFEGLFVKNLENVQGDERDHIIISTTYGPDSKGRFYRRFGPLGRSGGGRRLNVLVTRARDEVHLVSSIPETVYRNLPPIPPGESAGGVWLLFSYLCYAEFLARAYDESHQRYEVAESRKEVLVNARETRFPSSFSKQLAERLRDHHQIGSDVHWGNDGFCVDLALHHPGHPEDVTIGVQCDMNRFEQAADPIEWEVFRNWILESQGWKMNRLWSPQFFRDSQVATRQILKDMEEFLAKETAKDAIRVEKEG